MANITAENTAAFIEYGGDWNDDSDDIRMATAPNSTLTLRFTGTALWAFGEFDGSVDCQLDGRVCPTTTFQPSKALDRPFLALQNLVYGPHVLWFGYTGGAFGVSRLVWYDPNARWNEQYYEIDGLNVRFRETRNASAYITFLFEGRIYWEIAVELYTERAYNPGTGIAVGGLMAPFGDTFSTILDGRDPVNRITKSPGERHLAILHREDGLENKLHNLTLIKRGDTGWISICGVQVYIPQPTTPNTSTYRSSSGLSTGAKAGIAVGVLSIVGLLTLAALLYIRQRRAHDYIPERRAHVYTPESRAHVYIPESRAHVYIPQRRAHISVVPEEGNTELESKLPAESNDWDIPVGHNNEAREVPNMVSETRVDEAPRPRNLVA